MHFFMHELNLGKTQLVLQSLVMPRNWLVIGKKLEIIFDDVYRIAHFPVYFK